MDDSLEDYENKTPISQREAGFKGGIQLGTTAYDVDSRGLDTLVKAVGLSYKKTHDWSASLKGDERAKLLGVPNVVMKGMSPDGGIFRDSKGNISLVVEAKKQGPAGNAIERGADNLQSMYRLGAKKYVVIARGPGFFDNKSAQTTVMGWLANYNSPKDVHFGHNSGFLEVHRLRDNQVTEDAVREIFEKALSIAVQ